MASPNAAFTEMVTTTFRNHKRKLIDNVTNHNQLYRLLMADGKVKVESGGYEIAVPIDYAENGTFDFFEGYEAWEVAQSDVLSTVKYDWKQAVVNVTASGRELRANMSKERIINLKDSRIKNAMNTFTNKMCQSLYSDGTGYGGKEVGGLQALITNDGTGTVGGINAGTYTMWKNQFESATLSATTIKNAMQALWLKTARGNDRTNLIIAENASYAYYWDSLTDLQRYGPTGKLRSGAESDEAIMFNTAPVYFDSTDSGMPSKNVYFLNTEYLAMHVHRDCNLEVMEDRISINQDAVTVPVLWQGNLVLTNRARQGILFNS